MLEAALGKSVIQTNYTGDKRLLQSWQGLFDEVPRAYDEMHLYHLRREDDFATGILMRANELVGKIPGLVQQLHRAAMYLDNPANAHLDHRFFNCPDTSNHHFRLPRELAICFSETYWSTFPQQGITPDEWPGRQEDEVERYDNARGWWSANTHSWLNVDEAYKTKTSVEKINE